MTISIRLTSVEKEELEAISDYLKEQHYISFNQTDLIKYCIGQTFSNLPENYKKSCLPFTYD